MIVLTQERLVRTSQTQEDWTTPFWFAVYTKSRHEKCLHSELSKKKIPSFLPLRKIKRQWSDRVQTVEEPLFKSYLFVHAPLSQRLDVLNLQGAVSFVGKPSKISETDILNIQRLVSEDMTIDPFPYLRVGEKVYIRSGPLKGLEGFILRKNGRCRLILSIETLEQSVSVEVDESIVEPI